MLKAAGPQHPQWYPMTAPVEFADHDPLIIAEGEGV